MKKALNWQMLLKPFGKRRRRQENQNLPVPAVSKPDLDKSITTLMTIVSKGFENTMFEAGKYLIETFYGGDPKVPRMTRKNNLSIH